MYTVNFNDLANKMSNVLHPLKIRVGYGIVKHASMGLARKLYKMSMFMDCLN